MQIKIKCVDDSQKPQQIPKNKWIKKGEWYNLIFIAWCKPEECQGFSLAEIELDETCSPYEYYKGSRFAISEQDLEKFLEFGKLCSELDTLNIQELIEETEINILEEV